MFKHPILYDDEELLELSEKAWHITDDFCNDTQHDCANCPYKIKSDECIEEILGEFWRRLANKLDK